ncbi:MAG: hypothetical protein F6J93_03915 [Oscillatoria sp. SIO1A7]|nr:hypothetical protein [Oscillatoria sp. SIO1A7]
MRLLLAGLTTSLVLWALPVQAQVSNDQVVAIVEALRLAAPKQPTDELYSAWKIKPSLIPQWSRLCIGQELTVEEFVADTAKARIILTCVMEDVLATEYPASGNEEAIAIRRAAAWWVAGNGDLYDSGDIAFYTKKVLNFYQDLRANPGDFLPFRIAK